MSAVLKAQEANAQRKSKRKAEAMEAVDEAPRKKNKQRVLLLSSRGITHRMRHLMNDLEALLPHVKKGICLFFLSMKVLTEMQIQSWTPSHSFIYFLNLQISITVTTRCTSRPDGMRICIFGLQKLRMVQA